MRVAMLVVLVGAGLVMFGVGRTGDRPVFAQRPGLEQVEIGAASQQLIALSSDAGPSQQVTLIDPKTQVMGVYHIDRATGEIALKSVRKIRWDLLMEEFNATSPSPRDIRSLVEQP